MITGSAQGHVVEIASDAPSKPRLALNPSPPGSSVVNGGWWPRSWDAATELPGLLRELEKRFGPVTSVMLNRDTWTGTFRRLVLDDRQVRAGWFNSLDPALAIAATAGRMRLELLVVPPSHDPEAAERALALAAEGGRASAAEMLAADEPSAPDPLSTWDDEGGHARNGGRDD